ncbi:hypothetical protein DICSQDRAFT_157002 [Dichomitus squalens LYAD-421 SS1]|uniref:Histidine-specific methyltransferase SAM-dependent domain-containing protein n=1 Tax=Dichomitus squalens (strain LYAD-421) TaxID=732165 RepID=R7SSV5_DICSQ|nr:uncharacterized protein DICSQDRAFT_157002 [Dichomitus squalens LYAD-421 SS1]EJF58067.1 hypothetical protein DICSQDRAFT_157002 [Dichomitus squalens LYAD-421 SS1]
MTFNTSVDTVRILDIHPRSVPTPGSSIRDQVISGLMKPAGHKTLPNILLYDERGLHLYDELTSDAAEYYLFAAEKEILQSKAAEIVKAMQPGMHDGALVDGVIVELGAGALRKTSLILGALARLVPCPSPIPPISYYALDLEKRELERTLRGLGLSEVGTELQGKIATAGLWGTYNDGLQFITEGRLRDEDVGVGVSGDGIEGTEAIGPPTLSSQQPLHILFLGSSLGNFTREDAAGFLRSLPLRSSSHDTLLLGMDHGNDAQKIRMAYNDTNGVSRRFVMNGLRCAGRVLGEERLFDQEKWEYVGTYNEQLRKRAYYKSGSDQTIIDPETKATFPFVKDELIRVAFSHKFSEQDTYTLFTEANLHPVHRWTDSSSQYSLWLLQRQIAPKVSK